jgi:hypothetical protein
VIDSLGLRGQLPPKSDDPLAAAIQPADKRRRRWLLFMKIAVTAALLTWVLAQVGWPEFWRTLALTNVWLLLLVVMLRFGSMSLSALKWQQLLAVHGVRYAFNQLQGWYFISFFLSQFLPSLIGGDAYRIYKTYRNEKARVISVLAVLADRVTGLIVLLLVGYAAAIYVYVDTGEELAQALVWMGSIFFALLPVAVWVLFSRHRERFTASRFCVKPLRSLIEHADDYRLVAAHGRMALVWAASFAFHGIRVFTTWLILYAVGVFSDPAQVAVAVVAVTVAGMLPISIGGLGLMEGSFVYVMARYGVSPEAGLITMLLSRATLLPMFAAAGVYFMLERKRRPAAGRPLGAPLANEPITRNESV